jgi:glycosyltransferase involved in cell wall biosynthesis
MNKPVFHIPNLVGLDHFTPGSRTGAREALGIPMETHVIGFGAFSISSPYKGWEYFCEALHFLAKNHPRWDIMVLAFGSEYDPTVASRLPFKTKFLGFVRDIDLLAEAYRAMNIFVVPSLADNLPTTVLESLSCGVPVVGFNVGGIPEMIIHKENGYLARYRDSEDLANGMQYCLEHATKGKRLPLFEKNVIVGKHLDLLHHITGAKGDV